MANNHHASFETKVSFTIPFQYPVVFSHDIFSPDNPALSDCLRTLTGKPPFRALTVIDSGVDEYHPEIKTKVQEYARHHSSILETATEPLILPGGEVAKNNFTEVQKIIAASHQHQLCRQSLIICIGGGSLLDAVGFAAALIHRGLRLIRVPTTVLAQNDSGIGVKNGINLRGIKNFLGVFAPPAAVFNDALFLPTLDDRDWRSGIAEAFKVGIIKDCAFLEWLRDHLESLNRRDLATMETLIRRCAELHTNHIATAGDPFEFGSARPLDFGHWAGHKLESLSVNQLRHGEAVAIGMALDLLNAVQFGFIEDNHADIMIRALKQIGLPAWSPLLRQTDANGHLRVLEGIDEFRQHLGGTLHITMPCPLGAKTEVDKLPSTVVESSIDRLQHYDSDH